MPEVDVAVIGGGPAGAAAAARLAQLGRSVALFEQATFPRFHIGESLLPGSFAVFDALGLTPKLRSAGFLPKFAAEFVTSDGQTTRRYPFRDGLIARHISAYEVERASFDSLLLDHAAEQGAAVHHNAKVTHVECSANGCSLDVRVDKQTQHFSARIIIDASGQRSLLSQRYQLRQLDPNLKNVAVFSHYEGAARASGEAEGDISIVLTSLGWWWVIPLAGGRTSVGVVAPLGALSGAKPDKDYFTAQLAESPYLTTRLMNATQVEPVRTVADYSYTSAQLVGDGWLLAGDAAGFIDPVFSTGVHLGLKSGFRAAEQASRALGGRPSRAKLRPYERWLRRDMQSYRGFVSGFYTPEFVELMMSPTDRFQLRQAVTSLLAGEDLRDFGLRWRVLLFRTLVRLNKKWPLAPRLGDRREADQRMLQAGLQANQPPQLPG